jgi:3',5'-cyclic AMP phosphodiesterase CpdA
MDVDMPSTMRTCCWTALCLLGVVMAHTAKAQETSSPAGLRYQSILSADAPWPADGRETLLTFVHISDTHVGRRSDAEAFAIAIEAIERLDPQPAFVVITGDLTESFRDAEVLYLKHLVDRFTLPVLLVPGNHDVGFDPTPASIEKWNRAFPDFATPYARDFGPIRIVAMDAQLYNARRANTEVNAEGNRQWKAMVKMVRLAKREKRRTIMAYHIPIVPNFFRQRVSGSWRTADMKRMRALLANQEVEATLTGHLHRDETYLEDKTWMLNAPPVSLKYEREPSYRLFRVTDSGLMFRQVYLTEEGVSLSYQMDLHDVNAAQIDQSVAEMNVSELESLWGYRYAGDVGTQRLFRTLNVAAFTQFLREPFDWQPKDSRTRFFREDARPK